MAIAKQFVEVLIAPAFSDAATKIFAAKANTRVLRIALPTGGPTAWDQGRNMQDVKRIGSGLLIQDADNVTLDVDALRCPTRLQPHRRTARGPAVRMGPWRNT